MKRIEDTKQYRLGRRGEVVIYSFLIEHGGFTAFDQSGAAKGSAPVLNSAHGNMVAPDALMIGQHPLFFEFKTKTEEFLWGGGSREMRESGARIMPAGPAHGIDQRAFLDYCEANLRLPLVLAFLCMATGCLHAGSLDELGMPYPSVRNVNGKPMVNWPIKAMWPLVELDVELLTKFLTHTPPIQAIPPADERRQLLDWLRPRQLEFAAFHSDFLARREAGWSERGA